MHTQQFQSRLLRYSRKTTVYRRLQIPREYHIHQIIFFIVFLCSKSIAIYLHAVQITMKCMRDASRRTLKM